MTTDTIPPEAEAALAQARAAFGADLAGVWLHGSAVAGGLRPESDVDVLMAVETAVPQALARLLAGVYEISGRPGRDPGRRPLEIVVFTTDRLADPGDPPRAEFVWGEWLRADYAAGRAPGPEINPDFTLLLAQVRACSRALAGPRADTLVAPVSAARVGQAIAAALPALLADLEGDERNVLLTLARMWRTRAAGGFVAKDAAATWAMTRVDDATAAALELCRRDYLGLPHAGWDALRAVAPTAAARLAREVAAFG